MKTEIDEMLTGRTLRDNTEDEGEEKMKTEIDGNVTQNEPSYNDRERREEMKKEIDEKVNGKTMSDNKQDEGGMKMKKEIDEVASQKAPSYNNPKGSQEMKKEIDEKVNGKTPPDDNEDDPFDLSKLRLKQDFSQIVGVKKALLTVPVRKPNRQDFVRVHPDPGWRLEIAVLELKDERETYLVHPDVLSELPDEATPKVVFATINRQQVLTLWPISLPGEDGRHNEWSRSALQAAEKAMGRWIRVVSNMSLGAYEVHYPTGNLSEPEWPEVEFREVIKIAFRDRLIQDINHPVLRRLRGEV